MPRTSKAAAPAKRKALPHPQAYIPALQTPVELFADQTYLPLALLMSDLFAARQYGGGAKRPFFHGEREGKQLRFARDRYQLNNFRQTMGWQLDQADADVLFAILRLASTSHVESVACRNSDSTGQPTLSIMGVVVQFKGSALLRSINRKSGGSGLAWLKAVVERLLAAKYTWSVPGLYDQTLSLLYATQTPVDDGTFSVLISSDILHLYQLGFCGIPHGDRLQLTLPLAKWLQGYVHALAQNKHSLRIETILHASGFDLYDPTAMKRYREDLAAYQQAVSEKRRGGGKPLLSPERPSGISVATFSTQFLEPALAELKNVGYDYALHVEHGLVYITKPADAAWLVYNNIKLTKLYVWLNEFAPDLLVAGMADECTAPDGRLLKRWGQPLSEEERATVRDQVVRHYEAQLIGRDLDELRRTYDRSLYRLAEERCAELLEGRTTFELVRTLSGFHERLADFIRDRGFTDDSEAFRGLLMHELVHNNYRIAVAQLPA